MPEASSALGHRLAVGSEAAASCAIFDMLSNCSVRAAAARRNFRNAPLSPTLAKLPTSRYK
jgi:hypothetical protein